MDSFISLIVLFKNYLFSYFKNLLERYRHRMHSPRAKRANNPRSCGFIYLKLLDSMAKKLRPIIFKDLKVVANPRMVKALDKRTMIPKDLILMARAPKIPTIGRANKMLRLI